MKNPVRAICLIFLLALGTAVRADTDADASTHSKPWPAITSGETPDETQSNIVQGPELQRARSARAMLADSRRLDAALSGLSPQRPGLIDAYVVAVALDSDPVFGREAREAGKVLSARFDGSGRTLVLAGPDGRTDDLPRGSLTALTLALARIAEVMDPAEDVLVLYSTSHGADIGLAYHDGDQGYGLLPPARLKALLDELGIGRRLIMLSACYSGIFVPELASLETIVITAASSRQPSFGCNAGNDWTFFGDALINQALRKPQPFVAAAEEARKTISRWEKQLILLSSQPQIFIGPRAKIWLEAIESRVKLVETAPFGRPAISSAGP